MGSEASASIGNNRSSRNCNKTLEFRFSFNLQLKTYQYISYWSHSRESARSVEGAPQ
jgi:hypothetical protein